MEIKIEVDLKIKARFEFEPRDLWAGVHWKNERRDKVGKLHFWVIVIPMIPLHIVFEK